MPTRMERLVKDLLRLALLEAGKEPLETSAANLAPIIAGIVDDTGPGARAKGLRVTTSIDPATTAVAIDAAKVHDIVRNLVENAVNYTQEGGEVAVAAALDARTLVITVTDNGPGIPEEDLGRVFERFYRVDKSRGRPGGTGLGLAIVKHLAGLHGGAVSVENRPSGGAAFLVRLPLAAAARIYLKPLAART